MELLLMLAVLGLLLGAVLGWVSFFKISSLTKEIGALRQQLDIAIERISNLGPSSFVNDAKKDDNAPEPILSNDADRLSPETPTAAWIQPKSPVADVWTGPDNAEIEDQPRPVTAVKEGVARDDFSAIISRAKDQWMVWLGGISIGLAGIFMVRYSIEQGLLGPTARIVLSLLAGVVLHAVAEFGRRRSVSQYQAFAALAGGASIMLYAALLAALLLYNLLPSWLVFAALALVSLASMALAVLHGPVLAILGILGAYVIPLLVDTGSDSILGLYIYAIIISCAAILLMHYVYRIWLWGFMLLGSVGWWFLSLPIDMADGYRGYYLVALAYIYLALPAWDWLLRKPDQEIRKSSSGQAEDNGQHIVDAPIFLSITILVLAFGVSIIVAGSTSSAIYYWTPLVALLLIVAGKRDSLLWLPLGALVVQLLAWLALGLSFDDGIQLVGLVGSQQAEFLNYAGWMAFVYFALSLRNVLQGANQNLWFALAVMSPLAWMALCYLLTSDLSESLQWGSVTVVLGVVYLAIAGMRLGVGKSKLQSDQDGASIDMYSIWLIIAGHCAYSLAVAIMVRQAGLSLALSAQLLSLAWIIHRFDLPRIGLLLKLVLGIVVLRLTLNPWLFTYPEAVHWSLWTYGGATIFCVLAAWRLRDNLSLRKWLEAASLHLLVLTLWAETRYWLYDGEIFRARVELLEFAINTALWSSLGLVYYFRQQVSQTLKPLYSLASKILLCLALLGYAMMLLPLNPLWSEQEVASTPLFNILLLAYGFPVIISALVFRYYDSLYKKLSGLVLGLSGFIFVSLEIRHLWQGTLDIGLNTGNGELYTYTIVWLLIAMACLLGGSIRFGRSVYRAGFGLLMLVIGKIFLVDMADLEGLLRVASFMGLGLSLLGLAYLYQRFNLSPEKVVTQRT